MAASAVRNEREGLMNRSITVESQTVTTPSGAEFDTPSGDGAWPTYACGTFGLC
jgi:hypothetical protein